MKRYTSIHPFFISFITNIVKVGFGDYFVSFYKIRKAFIQATLGNYLHASIIVIARNEFERYLINQ